MTLRDELTALGRPVSVLVVGDARYRDGRRVAWALDGLHGRYGVSMLHAGDAPGAAALALAWADRRDVLWLRYDLERRDLSASRAAMLEDARPDLVVAFGGDWIPAARGLRVWQVKT